MFHCVLRLPNISTSSIGMHYGITLQAYLSELLVKDSHKHISSTEKPQITTCSSHLITHYHYVRVTEKYMETLHVKKMADLVAVT